MAWPPARGRPGTTKVPCKGAPGCGLGNLQERPTIASSQSGPRKGGACGHNTRRQAAYEQKLPPARAIARRGDAHGGATHGRGIGRKGSSAHPLAWRLPASKGTAACVGALVAT
ncbi:hypothetical protein BHE74_00048904 [Ensete ventricosum]|nr:hypothetical protein BHE74_00048904 [Ensete ventricosum]